MVWLIIIIKFVISFEDIEFSRFDDQAFFQTFFIVAVKVLFFFSWAPIQPFLLVSHITIIFRMAKLVKKQAVNKSFSLEQLLEKVQNEDLNQCNTGVKKNDFINPILDGLQKINVKKQKKVIKPTFEAEKTVIEKKNITKDSQKQSIQSPIQRNSSSIICKPVEKRQKQNSSKKTPAQESSAYKSKSSKNDQGYKPIYSKGEDRQFQTKREQYPSKITNYPITFHQSMVYKGVELNISFGSFKHYYSSWKQKCAMVVSFSEVNEINSQVSYFLELQSQQGSQFLKQIQQREVYNYVRTGEVMTYNKKNSSYDKIYFLKTPKNNVQAHLFSNQIEQSIAKLVQNATTHEIQCLHLSWLRWGRVKSQESAKQMFNGMIKKIKSLGAKKSLSVIKIYLKNLPQYEIFSSLFRQLCDEYMRTFYK